MTLALVLRGHPSRSPFPRSRPRWKQLLPASALLLASSGLAGIPARAEDTPAAASQPAPETELSRLLDEADRVASSSELVPERYRDDLLDGAGRLRSTAGRLDSLSELNQRFAIDGHFPDARDAAVSIDRAHVRERVRGLIRVAVSEREAGHPEAAWLSLKEAQRQALQMRDATDLIGVLREISAEDVALRKAAADLVTSKASTGKQPDVAAGLAAAAGALLPEALRPKGPAAAAASSLDPAPNDVIESVLESGVPGAGYHEVEILRAGGGPLREPQVISHPYFYNGDRWFQGPRLAGGQTCVQVTNPRTGLPCCISVNLPAGAPIIEYDRDSIEYYYDDVVVDLHFKRSGDVEVRYRELFNFFDHRTKVIEERRIRALRAIGQGSATDSALDGLANIGLGAPLNVANRLPVLSDLLGRSTKRTPATLTPPR